MIFLQEQSLLSGLWKYAAVWAALTVILFAFYAGELKRKLIGSMIYAVVLAVSIPVNQIVLETQDVPNVMQLPWDAAAILVGISDTQDPQTYDVGKTVGEVLHKDSNKGWEDLMNPGVAISETWEVTLRLDRQIVIWKLKDE